MFATEKYLLLMLARDVVKAHVGYEPYKYVLLSLSVWTIKDDKLFSEIWVVISTDRIRRKKVITLVSRKKDY